MDFGYKKNKKNFSMLLKQQYLFTDNKNGLKFIEKRDKHRPKK